MTQVTHYGNILDNVLDNAIICHGCNKKGSMGKGIALSIKQKYGKAYKDYINAYNSNNLGLGTVIFSHIRDFLFIANAVTQDKYWSPGDSGDIVYADYDAIRKCFKTIAAFSKEQKLPVHYPMVGAGLAKGNWNIINKIICEELDGIEHHLWILQ